MSSSWALLVVASGPVAGHVYDGPRPTSQSTLQDMDSQSDMTAIYAHWEGFYDPHTLIKGFYVRIGTCSGCGDVMNEQPVGITDGTLTGLNASLPLVK